MFFLNFRVFGSSSIKSTSPPSSVIDHTQFTVDQFFGGFPGTFLIQWPVKCTEVIAMGDSILPVFRFHSGSFWPSSINLDETRMTVSVLKQDPNTVSMLRFVIIAKIWNRMTASVLKQDPNTKKFKLWHGHKICKFSGKSPSSSHKTTLKQQLNG